jgi:3-methyladenine DNA glycosylase/8-oxoguanine DNA glycosylase
MTPTLNLRAAVRHLKAADPVLAGIITRVGPCRWEMQPVPSVFEALAMAIVYQQLHGRAALTIHNRVLDLYPDRQPDPARFLELSDESLRAAGLSRAKLASIRDLAAKAVAGVLPTMIEAHAMGDNELVERLTIVRGVGPWTVHMFQMVRLGRPDVLPTGDFGIREAFRVGWRKRRQPTPVELEKHARAWRPWRTIACWYLWRSLDA